MGWDDQLHTGIIFDPLKIDEAGLSQLIDSLSDRIDMTKIAPNEQLIHWVRLSPLPGLRDFSQQSLSIRRGEQVRFGKIFERPQKPTKPQI